jgi:DNA-binding phage protein
MQLSESALAALISEVGAPRASCGKLVLDVPQIIAMRQARFSWAQIAEHFGVSRMTVYRRLKGDPDRSTERIRTETGKRLLAALASAPHREMIKA